MFKAVINYKSSRSGKDLTLSVVESWDDYGKPVYTSGSDSYSIDDTGSYTILKKQYYSQRGVYGTSGWYYRTIGVYPTITYQEAS